MSDQTSTAAPETTLSSPAGTPVIAAAQQALAVKELGDAVAGMKKKFKTLWIVTIVVAVIAIASAVFSIGPMLGLNLRGGAMPNRAFNRTGTTGTSTGTNGGTVPDQGVVPPAQ